MARFSDSHNHSTKSVIVLGFDPDRSIFDTLEKHDLKAPNNHFRLILLLHVLGENGKNETDYYHCEDFADFGAAKNACQTMNPSIDECYFVVDDTGRRLAEEYS